MASEGVGRMLTFGKKAQARREEQARSAAVMVPREPLLTVGDAAAFLRLTTGAVYARIERGQMSCLRLGWGKRARIRFTREMLVDSLRHESSAVTDERVA